MRRAICCVVSLFVILVSVSAQAEVLCSQKKKSTGMVSEGASIRIRSSCRVNEIQLEPTTLGLQGPAGPQGEPGFSYFSPSSLYEVTKTYDLMAFGYYFLGAKCNNPGDVVITGGVSNYSTGINRIDVKRSAPWNVPGEWNVDVQPYLDGTISILIKCLRMAP